MSVSSEAKTLLRDLGRAGANALFPNDFEYYLVSMELVDSRGKTVDMLTWPVNPSSFNQSNPEITKIKKTAGGVTSLSSESFVPKKITMSGTFGRKFRLLLGSFSVGDIIAQGNSIGGVPNSAVSTGAREFNVQVKNGYGTMKKVEKLCLLSNQLDKYNQPYKLYFYNLMNNGNFLVEVSDFSMSQNESSSNMLWNYSLSLTGVAPIDQIVSRQRSVFSISSMGAVQKRTQSLLSNVKKSLDTVVEKTL